MIERSPTSRNPRDEQLHRRQELAASCRMFAERGFEEGVGGHITARDPVRPDHFWVNPFGMQFGQVRVSDLLLVDPSGEVVAGEGTVNQAGYTIHSQIHAELPHVVAAAHAHSSYGRAWSALGRHLDPITQDACAFYERHHVHVGYNGIVLDEQEGKQIALSLGGEQAVILRNHGLLTVGGNVGEAVWWFITMDRSCQVQLLAEAVGRPHLIEPEAARAARDVIGTPRIARLTFRSLYADIVRRQPDLLD